MSDQSQEIFSFITDALKVAEAPFKIINDELIMAQCRVEVPRTFFTPARTETANLQMVRHPDLLEKYPGSELVTRGSYRLQWFVDGIKKRGLIFRGALLFDLDHRRIEREINQLLPPDHPGFFYKQPLVGYQPHLLANFKVSLETDEKFEELHSLSINLVTGEICSNLLRELQGKKFSSRLPPQNLEQKKIPYSEGFQAIHNHLRWIMQNHDAQWIAAAKTRWEEEVRCLEAYYQGEESTADRQGFYRQVADLYRKFQPKIKFSLINVGLFYLPLVRYLLEPWGTIAEIPPLIYDPIQKKIVGLLRLD